MDAHRFEAIRKKLDQAGLSTEGLSDEDLSQLVRAAQEASSAEELVENIFGDEALVSALCEESRDWSADHHRNQAVELSGQAEELDRLHPGDPDIAHNCEDSGEHREAVIESMDLCLQADFHAEAARLLDERGLAALADFGPPEVASRILMQRLRDAGGAFSGTDAL